MFKQIAILHEGTKYFTFFGSNFIANRFPNTNVITQSDIMSSNAVMSEYRKYNNKLDARQTPVANPDTISWNNKYLISTGTIEFNGKTFKYGLSVDSLDIIDTDEEKNVVKEEHKQKQEQAVKEEPKQQTDPVMKEEPKQNSEPIIKEEPTLNPTVKNDSRRNRHGMRFGGVSIPKPVERKAGIQFGGRDEETFSAISNIGVTTTRKVGIVFGNQPVESEQNTRTITPQSTYKTKFIPIPKVEESEHKLDQKVEEPVTEDLSKKWTTIPLNTPIKEEEKDPVVESLSSDTTNVKEEDAKTAAKQAVRKTLSNEVNAIIGDIPEEMLGNIMEFTSHPVDVERLNNERDMYCIDQRWHRQGKWFCIDVIPNVSRYFFNSRKSVSMEISIATLKAWKEALNTNG